MPAATDTGEIRTLEEVVARLDQAGQGESISVQDMLEALGQRSFAPLLLAPSLLLVSPLSGVPGAGTAGAVIIAVVAFHLMLGRERLWLPGLVLRRSVSRERLRQATRFLKRPAAFVDRLIGPRLTFLTRGFFPRVIGAICLAIALVMPPLELVPMTNSMSAAAISAFALALLAHDGLLALLALAAASAGLYWGLGYLLPL